MSLTTDRQKYKNIVAHPKVSLFIIDPKIPFGPWKSALPPPSKTIPASVLFDRIVRRYGQDPECFPAPKKNRVAVRLRPIRSLRRGDGGGILQTQPVLALGSRRRVGHTRDLCRQIDGDDVCAFLSERPHASGPVRRADPVMSATDRTAVSSSSSAEQRLGGLTVGRPHLPRLSQCRSLEVAQPV